MNRTLFLTLFISLTCVCIPPILMAQDKTAETPSAGLPSGWGSFVRGGAVYQFDTDLDKGGSYSATRFTIQAGSGYSWTPQTKISFSFGYSYNGYDISHSNGYTTLPEWTDIHTISFGAPMRFRLNDHWTGFFLPSIRSTGESGASFDETITGGIIGGFSYRFSKSLTIGPGVGVISQLEESATIIPILIIDWKITDKWSLDTGRGLGATLGPGLTLSYQPNPKWRFGIGGRYEKLRFRLDKNGSNASGVGEDSSFPVFASGTYTINPKVKISLLVGLELGGELNLENEDGKSLSEESYDNAIFSGVTFSGVF